MHRLVHLIATVSTVSIGCGPTGTPAAEDSGPPILEIVSPERGTTSPTTSIEITGRAVDDIGVAEVSVNGVAAKLDGDGNFAVTLNATEGITLLETVAIDDAGNEARDARAVLAGTLVDLATPVAAGLVGHLDSSAMAGLGVIVGDVANGIDWTALAKTYNPVAGSGGTSCNSYQAYIDSVSHGGFAVDTTAADGGIGGAVRVVDLDVRGHINWRGLCASGTEEFRVTASAFDLGALIAPRLEGAAIQVGLEDVSARFTNFQLSVSNVPGFVEDHFEPRVRDKIAEIVRDKARELVPPLATDYIGDFLATTHELDLLGRTIGLSVWPTAMSWTTAGGTITLDGVSAVDGAEGGVFLSSPRRAPMDAMLGSTGLAVAVADDVLNQLLAGMWTSGAFADAMVPLKGDTLDAVFGAEGTQATITMSLPPVASFDRDGPAQLVIGDLEVEAVAPSGETLARFVVSAEIELTARAGGMGIALSTETGRILAQILETSPALVAPLDANKALALADIAIRQLAGRADDLLTGVPLPGIDGASIEPSILASAGGYLVLGGDLGFE